MTSLIVAFVVYIAIGKLSANLAKGVGMRETRSVNV